MLSNTKINLQRAFALFLFVGVILLQQMQAASACLPGWNYRVPIIIENNSTQILTNQQVSFSLNTLQLISEGKMRQQGMDIRFLSKDDQILSHWINESTYNTANTEIWVKLPNLAASTNDTIYLFYGNNAAPSTSDGESTFLLFDDFNDAAFNTTKWNSCGTGSITETAGTLQIGNGDILFSANTFTDTLDIHLNVNSITDNAQNGVFVINEADSTGFGMLLDQQSVSDVFTLKALEPNAGCITENGLLVPLATSTTGGILIGDWNFQWLKAAEQNLNWESGNLTVNDGRITYPTNAQVGLMREGAAGDFELNWLAVAKYTSATINITLDSEESLATPISVSGANDLCEGDNLALSVPLISGATYTWRNEANVIVQSGIDSVSYVVNSVDSLLDAGTYSVAIDLSACAFTATAEVSINKATEKGTTTGEDTVCYLDGTERNVQVSGFKGTILFWESSLTGSAPWNTITETNDTLTYKDLTATTYYRPVIQNGSCDMERGDSIKITVDPQTEGGRVIGGTTVCESVNGGDLNLIEHTGSILNWQYSLDNTNWTDTAVTVATFTFTNLTDTTYYRAVVSSGVCDTAYSQETVVIVNPTPPIAWSADSVCFGNLTNFTSNTLTGATYAWSFGAGQTSTLQNPTHLFPLTGTQSVNLIITSAAGCANDSTRDVVIYPNPDPAFTVNEVCEDDSTTFLNASTIAGGKTITSYIWDYDDAADNDTLSTDADIKHLYIPGTYNASLTTISEDGCLVTETKEVTVNSNPQANFEVDSVALGNATFFNNLSSIPSGSVTYLWSFGDPANNTSTNFSPSFTYPTVDTFSVRLQATSLKGCIDSLTKEALVFSLPTANFSNDTVCLNVPTAFVNSSSQSGKSLSDFTFNWDFGDGNTSTLQDPTYTYASSGTFAVTLTVTSSEGSDQITKFVKVNPLPIARFTVNNVCDGQQVSFTNTSLISAGVITTTNWNLGDGNSATTNDVTTNYTTSGVYDVTLTTISDEGCSDTFEDSVIVYPLPQVTFSVDAVCDGTSSILVNQTTIADVGGQTQSISSLFWDFGDQSTTSTTGSTDSVPHLYLNAGSYTATLTATSNQSCQSSNTATTTINELPIANFSAPAVCVNDQTTLTDATIYNGAGTLSYTWDLGDGNTRTGNPTQNTYAAAGSYDVKLVVTSPDACVDSTIKAVIVNGLPSLSNLSADATISLGDSIQLKVDGGSPQWVSDNGSLDDPSSNTPVARPLVTESYRVSVLDDNGCRSEDDTVTITVIEDFKVTPNNVLTPDGNGENDAWIINNIENYGDCHVQVFDRTGNIVFEERAYQNDWEGTRGKDILPDGTYYYFIEFSASDVTYRGAMSILRNRK